MASLKSDFVSGIFWGLLDKISVLIIGFTVTVILSRALSPKDYGIIGLLMIFNAIGLVLIDSGFGHAIIRKKNVTNTDYSTIFYFNIFLGILIYLILFFCSTYIARFYNEEQLINISRISFLIIPISSISIIQNSILIRNLNFKKITITSIISTFLSGIIGIYLAIHSYGVWSLVYQNISMFLFRTIFFWILGSWLPTLEFKFSTIKELWNYSLNLLGVNLMAGIFQNIFTLLIGKFYLITDVGYYNQALRMESMPRQSLNNVIQSTTYPTLSKFQEDDHAMKYAYKKIILLSIFLNFPLMFGLIVPAEKIFCFVLSEKWLPSVEYFRLLCITGALSPFILTTVIILKAKGLSNRYFILELVNKALLIAAIILTLGLNIKFLLIGYVIVTFLTSILNMQVSGRSINYTLIEQIKDLLPIAFSTAIMVITMYFLNIFISDNLTSLIFQFGFGTFSYFTSALLLNIDSLKELKLIFINKIKQA